MKILNIRSIHTQLFGRAKRPTNETIGRAHAAARKNGISLGSDGRAYARFLPSTPVLHGRNGRWQNGKVVPRKRAAA